MPKTIKNISINIRIILNGFTDDDLNDDDLNDESKGW